MIRPTLVTARLILRPFAVSDAADVQRLAGAQEVALNTLHIPHPYPDGKAVEWITGHEEAFDSGREVVFAITIRPNGELAGAIGLVFKKYDIAEIGYWIGMPYWGRGFATEAAGAVIDYGFEERGVNRIEAQHFSRNPPSGRVMAKNGMRHEGTFRQSVVKWDEYLDVEWYAILRSDWQERRP
jgi:RimJ/RimL family protein N-acetyltransferase